MSISGGDVKARSVKILLVGSNALWLVAALAFWEKRPVRQPSPVEKKVGENPYLSGQVKNTIVKNSHDLQKCYQAFLAQKPAKPQASIKIDWEIDRAGNPRHVQKVANEFGDDEKSSALESCVIVQIAAWRFPEPPQAEPVYVAHRFFFGEHRRGAPQLVNVR